MTTLVGSPSSPPPFDEILIVAGEASGDVHGAGLMRELGRRRPGVRFFGMGGQAMREAGLDALFDASEISVMGIVEVLPKLARILGVLRALTRAAKERRPRAAVLIDVPDFNLRLAKRLKKLGIPVVYYISPMVWAWRQGRVRQIAKRVDEMLCILPFEVDFYRRRGVEARYVGSPVLEQVPEADTSVAPFRERLALPAAGTMVALLPGSRMSEIRRHADLLAETAATLKAARPELEFVVPLAPTVPREALTRAFEARAVAPRFVEGRVAEVIGACDAAAVCSGTAALEAALMQRPMAVFYRTSFVTWALVRLMTKVRYASLANLIAGKGIIPELIQFQATAKRLTSLLAGWLDAPASARGMLAELAEVRARLGAPGASAHAAEAVAAFLERRRP